MPIVNLLGRGDGAVQGIRRAPELHADDRRRFDSAEGAARGLSELDFNNGVTLDGFRIPALQDPPRGDRSGASRWPVVRGRRSPSTTRRRPIARLSPSWSQLPIIGALFKSKAERQERTELLVLITPRLARPLNPDEVPPPPTMPGRFLPPGDELSEKFEGGGGTVDGPAVDPRLAAATSAVSEAMSTRTFDQVGARRDADPGRVLIAGPDCLQHLRHRLRSDVGGTAAGAERRRCGRARRRRLDGVRRERLDHRTPAGPARTAAQQMALTNFVWGQAPDVTSPPTCSSRTRPPRSAHPIPTAIRRASGWTSIATRRAAIRCRRCSAAAVGAPVDRRPSDRHRASGGRERQRLPQAVGGSRQMARRLRRDGADGTPPTRGRPTMSSRHTPSRAAPTPRWGTRMSTRRPRRPVPVRASPLMPISVRDDTQGRQPARCDCPGRVLSGRVATL